MQRPGRTGVGQKLWKILTGKCMAEHQSRYLKCNGKVLAKKMNGAILVITKKLLGWVDNSSYSSIHVNFQLSVATPADAGATVPLIMELVFVFSPGMTLPQDTSRKALPSWKQQVLQKGWGYAVLIPTSVQADHRTGLTGGIIGLVNKGTPRKPDNWSAGKALDYFENDKDIDRKRAGKEEVDALGLFMAAEAAGAENRMLGERDLGTSVFPAVSIMAGIHPASFGQPSCSWPNAMVKNKKERKKNVPHEIGATGTKLVILLL